MNRSREPWEEWNRVLEKVAKGEGVLDERERTTLLVNRFVCDVELGGLSTALYNLSPAFGEKWTELRATSVALKAIGSSATSEILDEIAILLEAQVITEPTIWKEVVDRAIPEKRLTELDADFEAAVPELWEGLERFTRANFG